MYYQLIGKIPSKCDMFTWARQMEKKRRVVSQTTYTINGDEIYISTVFLGLDHGIGQGPPLLFETMIFGGMHDQYQRRCSTWKQAENQHTEAIKLIESAYALKS